MTRSKHHPTLDDAKAQFLATIQAEQTAETYRWGLNAFQRFAKERMSKVNAGQDDEPPYSTDQLQDDVLEELYYWLNEQNKSPQTTRTYLSAVR